MRGNIMYKLTRLTLIFCVGALLGAGCDIPISPPAEPVPTPEPLSLDLKGLSLYYYPGEEVIFYEKFGLLSTDIFIPALDYPLESYTLQLHYDSALLQYESLYSPLALAVVCESPGVVEIRVPACRIEAGEWIKLGSVTWMALATGFTEITLEPLALSSESGQPFILPPAVVAGCRVVKELGTLSFAGPTYLKEGSSFIRTIELDTEGKVILEYELDILYDSKKITPESGVGEQGILPGAFGFLTTVTPGEERLHLSGISATGSGSGSGLEFLQTHWLAVDSGRAVLSMEVQKLITADAVYLKPEVRGSTLSIYTQNNKPIMDLRIEPANVSISSGASFMTSLMLNTEGYVLAAYGINLLFDPLLLDLDRTKANGMGLEAGADGFLTAHNSLEPGVIQLAGFDLTGKQPNPALELLRIYWQSRGPAGVTAISPDARSLSDIRSREIGRFRIFDCNVSITE